MEEVGVIERVKMSHLTQWTNPLHLVKKTSKTMFNTDQPLGKTGISKIRGKKLVLKMV